MDVVCPKCARLADPSENYCPKCGRNLIRVRMDKKWQQEILVVSSDADFGPLMKAIFQSPQYGQFAHAWPTPAAVTDVLSPLQEKERQVLIRRYGLDGNSPRSIKEISEEYVGISDSAIRLEEHKALRKIRYPMKVAVERNC